MEIHVNKKHIDLTPKELEQLTKEELIAKILQLDAHNKQLKNILHKTLEKDVSADKHKSTSKSFDFNKCYKRHVLLKLLYLGWDYQGYASQEDTQATIEYHLFKALQKTCLIEKRENSNYNRCGRTDKGVSAFCQVISIDLRSKFPEDEQLKSENFIEEIDYCGILNRVLPDNIRCISWMPLKDKMYSARFDCIQRTYRYYFPAANLNIKAMQIACGHLIGKHDFRNLCKMDVANGVKSFVRKVISADIKSCNFPMEKSNHKSYEMKYLEIVSQAFLWHQIRCIMAILLLIGQGYEDSSIIEELLDIEKNPCKPQYNLANGLPLNLYLCEFRDENSPKSCYEDEESPGEFDKFIMTKWICNKASLCKLIEDLQAKWTIHSIQTTMIREMISDIEKIYSSEFNETNLPSAHINVLLSNKQKQYQKLFDRKRCESFENRLNHYVKKKRLIVSQNK